MRQITCLAAEKFSNNFKILRINRNLSIKQVSIDIGLSQGFLTDIENLKKLPSLVTVDKIANYFDVEIYELFL